MPKTKALAPKPPDNAALWPWAGGRLRDASTFQVGISSYAAAAAYRLVNSGVHPIAPNHILTEVVDT